MTPEAEGMERRFRGGFSIFLLFVRIGVKGFFWEDLRISSNTEQKNANPAKSLILLFVCACARTPTESK
jgi:hypothetical protein